MKHEPEQPDLFPLSHKPLIPPRRGHDGEQVYASVWEATMTSASPDSDENSTPFHWVLHDMAVAITQRHATIAATVATWLGCNIGQCMLATAERERSVGRWDARDCYLFAWTRENRRVGCVNHGVRAIEYMMAPPETRRRTSILSPDSGLTELPSLSAEDLEVVEHFMQWLAERDGQQYLTRCRAKLEGIEHEKRLLREADCIRRRQEAAAA